MAPKGDKALSRNPRIWFMGHKVAVDHGTTALAKAAVESARKKTWDPKQWNADMLAVLRPFRRGISRGGSRAAAASTPRGPQLQASPTRAAGGTFDRAEQLGVSQSNGAASGGGPGSRFGLL